MMCHSGTVIQGEQQRTGRDHYDRSIPRPLGAITDEDEPPPPYTVRDQTAPLRDASGNFAGYRAFSDQSNDHAEPAEPVFVPKTTGRFHRVLMAVFSRHRYYGPASQYPQARGDAEDPEAGRIRRRWSSNLAASPGRLPSTAAMKPVIQCILALVVLLVLEYTVYRVFCALAYALAAAGHNNAYAFHTLVRICATGVASVINVAHNLANIISKFARGLTCICRYLFSSTKRAC